MITETDVKKIASLSMLKIEDDKVLYFTEQLDSIVRMLDELKDVECDVEPLISVHSEALRLEPNKEDVQILPDNEVIFSNLPKNTSNECKELVSHTHCFIVPKVIE